MARYAISWFWDLSATRAVPPSSVRRTIMRSTSRLAQCLRLRSVALPVSKVLSAVSPGRACTPTIFFRVPHCSATSLDKLLSIAADLQLTYRYHQLLLRLKHLCSQRSVRVDINMVCLLSYSLWSETEDITTVHARLSEFSRNACPKL
jgi:hypothetical protein